MKRKININRPNVSADEINKHKNFDSVLKNSTAAGSKPLFKKPWFLSAVVASVAVIVIAGLVLTNKNEKPPVVVNPVADESDSIRLAAFYKNEESKPCIAPPIEGLNVPYVIYKVNAEKGGKFDFKTGSKLTIPQNAFVDETGKPLKGEIELRYREFHDAADFFVSGIPMTYDSAGVKYQFESAGMMEMLAYKDGNQVQMAPGKTIKVELASAYQGTEYNLYKLDTLKNNWSCLGKDKVENENKNSKDQSLNNDVSAIVKVQDAPEYKAIEQKIEEVETVKENKIAALPKPAEAPKKPLKASKDKYTFNLELDLTEFPEFAVYKNVKWELGSENKNVNNAMWTELNKTLWEDVTLKEGKKGENYLLSLKKGKKQVNDLVVYPVFEGQNYELAMNDFQEKFKKYTEALDKRKIEEKKIQEKYEADLANAKKQQAEFEEKWKRERNNELASLDTEQKVMRVFQVSSFGVYNCDNPSVYPKGIMCNAVLTNEQEAKLMCYEVYLVDKTKNGLFTYNRNPITRLSFDPKASNILWTVENGVLYYIKQDGFALIRSGSQTIKMNKVDQKFKTVEEMKTFFSI
jgi:hypothetical protein